MTISFVAGVVGLDGSDQWRGKLRLRLLLRQLLLEPARLLDRLAGGDIGEILELEELAQLDLAVLAVAERRRRALRPLDRLVAGFDLDQPVAGDESRRVGEGAVDDGALAA